MTYKIKIADGKENYVNDYYTMFTANGKDEMIKFVELAEEHGKHIVIESGE